MFTKIGSTKSKLGGVIFNIRTMQCLTLTHIYTYLIQRKSSKDENTFNEINHYFMG